MKSFLLLALALDLDLVAAQQDGVCEAGSYQDENDLLACDRTVFVAPPPALNANPNDSPGPSPGNSFSSILFAQPTYALAPTAIATLPPVALPAPCSLNNWLHELAPWLGPPGAASTRDVCKAICPGRKDVSRDFMPPPATGGPFSYLPSTKGVCIIASQVFSATIDTTNLDDCVFICEARSNVIMTHDGDDRMLMKRAVNNDVKLGSGGDRATIKPWARYNTVSGDDKDDKIFVEGDHNKLKGGIGHDMLRVRGTWNIVEGGPDDDDIGAEGNQNMLYGEDGDDTLFVPTMGGSLNILDGGPHVATDTCGADCMANTCVDCFP